MRVILFGSTGMIGGGALLECLADDRVAAVQTISRSPTGVSHPKLTEVLGDGRIEGLVPALLNLGFARVYVLRPGFIQRLADAARGANIRAQA